VVRVQEGFDVTNSRQQRRQSNNFTEPTAIQDSSWVITRPVGTDLEPAAIRTGKITVRTAVGTGNGVERTGVGGVRSVRAVVYDDEEEEEGERFEKTWKTRNHSPSRRIYTAVPLETQQVTIATAFVK